MKKALGVITVAIALMSCGNATDGNANTDTTKHQIDTGGVPNPNDTANHVNTSTGEYPKDTLNPSNTRGDVRSSNPTAPSSRGTTPGNNNKSQKQ